MPGFLDLAVDKYNLWDNGQDLRVKFLGGTENIHKQVERFAKEWENHANINLRFVNEGDADIRVSFDQHIGSHSQVGKAALSVEGDGPTMNLAIMDSTRLAEVKRQVLHEFGHALGCIHEHCSPAADIQWNDKEVCQYYQKEKEWVDQNIFQKYDPKHTKYSNFDPESIMMYRIPSSLTKNGFSVSYNWKLSERDKEFIAEVYPRTGGLTDLSSRISNAIMAICMGTYDFWMGFLNRFIPGADPKYWTFD